MGSWVVCSWMFIQWRRYRTMAASFTLLQDMVVKFMLVGTQVGLPPRIPLKATIGFAVFIIHRVSYKNGIWNEEHWRMVFIGASQKGRRISIPRCDWLSNFLTHGPRPVHGRHPQIRSPFPRSILRFINQLLINFFFSADQYAVLWLKLWCQKVHSTPLL